MKYLCQSRAWAIYALICVLCSFAAAQTRPVHPAPSASSAFDRIAKEAEAARNDHHLDDAIALYKKGLAIRSSWAEGWWYLGSLYYDLDNYKEARDAFLRLTALDSKTGGPWAMLGLCEFQTGDYKPALAHLSQGLNLGLPENQQLADVAHYHFALLLTRDEHYDEAMKVLSNFAERNLDSADFIEAMGLAALRKPLLPKELPPTERELVMDVGRAMYDGAGLRVQHAAAQFRILLEKYPSEPNIHFLYGSFLLLSDPDKGLVELKKELEISPDNVPALVTIAAEYVRRQDFKAALPYAEKAAADDPQFFATLTMLGRILTEGDIDAPRGLQELELAKKIAPNSPQVRIALATAYTKLGRKDDAARERQEFLRLRKQSELGGAPTQ